MRRILSLPGLAVAVWMACLGFIGLLGIMLALLAWHPHFLPATSAMAMVVVTGLALLVGASWRIVRGPDRRAALAWLLLGSAPLWFLAGFFLYGLAVGSGRKIPTNLPIKVMVPLAESLMDLDARFRYPQRTVGEKVVMISAPIPGDEARAQVAAMDRHVRALEARLGLATTGTIDWARGPLLGMQGKAVFGLCMGSRPSEAVLDVEGLATLDRHEVAHCVLTSHCSARFDPPAVLTEGWAEANSGQDSLVQAVRIWKSHQTGGDFAFTLRQITGPDWYNRHDSPVYVLGAPLVNFLLERFGPERFLELYSTCTQSTFEADCRRILGLDLDQFDTAFWSDVERIVTDGGPVASRQLARLRLGRGVDADRWKAFLAEYFAGVEPLLAPYRNVRLTVVNTYSYTDVDGRTETSSSEIRLSRSGPFASIRGRWPTIERAMLAHPRRSILAHRDGPDDP